MKIELKKLVLIYFWIPIAIINLTIFGEPQFVYLAKSFLEGQLYLTHIPLNNHADLSPFNSHYFWPLGPFPAIILLPFVSLFSTNFSQGYIQLPLNLFNFYLVYKIGRRLHLEKDQAYLLAFFFIFGSTYTPIAAIPFSWYFAQVIATTLLLSCIYEFLTKRRYLVIGILLSFAVLTRSNLILASLFFILTIKKDFLKNITKLLIPVTASLVILGSYNSLRFGNFLESGYKYQLIPEESERRREEGLISLVHIPTNLYYMLIKSFDPITNAAQTLTFPYLRPSHYGLSIIILSPILLLLLKTRLKDKYVKPALLTVLAIALSVITYYGIGYVQVGYRYALDFLPFLLIPLAYTFSRTSLKTLYLLVSLGIVVTWFALIVHISRS